MRLINVLLLEDNEFDAELIELEIEQSNLPHCITRVETRSDYKQALESHHYDLILSDYSLPQFDGLQALQIAQKCAPDTPFIIVTGSLSEETAADSIKSGAWDYVVKQRLFRLTGSIKNALELQQQISQKQIAQRELIRSEQRYRTLVESAEQPIFLVDRSGVTLYANDKAAVILQDGIAEDLVGSSIRDLLPENISADFMEKVEEALDTGSQVKFTYRCMKHDTEVWLTCRLSPVSEPENHIDQVLIIATDITNIKQSEARLLRTLKEKDVLLKEVHHRVKNNMQVITSLLNMQVRYTKDVALKRLLGESESRIRSMLLIHETLYQSEDISYVHFHSYINTMIDHLLSSYLTMDGNLEIVNNVDDVSIDVNTAIPCGLIINELITSMFEEKGAGVCRIVVGFHQHPDGTYEMEVSHDGQELPDDFDIEKANTMGMSVLRALKNQLNARLDIHTKKPVTYNFTFKEPHLQTYGKV